MDYKHKMDPPEQFRFPFPPYPIQEDFMRNLFLCLDGGKLGIFESPTGTGKSLSLICGSLTWLEAYEWHKKNQLEEELKNLEKSKEAGDSSSKSSGEPSWFTAAKQNVFNTQKVNQVKQELAKITLKEEKVKKLYERAKVIKKRLATDRKPETKPNYSNKLKKEISENKNPEDEFLIDDPKTDSDSEDEEESEETEDVRIIFASRTHSQISQFVREVEKSPFGKHVRVCTLASRQQMCINENVTRLKSSNLINERCLEMQRKKGSSATCKSDDGRALKKSKNGTLSACSFLNSQRVQDLRDLSLSQVVDVENLVPLGREQQACPYYSSRSALPDAQLIVVPYATLLHRSTREASGLKLKNSVVIIDEAHNLLETISSIHNVQVGGGLVSHAHWQLTHYQQRFSTRLSPRNLLHIKQLLFLLSCLMKSLGLSIKDKEKDKDDKEDEKVFEVIDFSVNAGFDHLNLHKLVEFCEKSKLPQKLAYFKPSVASVQTSELSAIGGLKTFLNKLKPEEGPPTSQPLQPPVEAESDDTPMPASPLMTIVDFMRCLQNPCRDGRIICVRKTRPSQSYLKYLLLNPATLFSDFVEQPRAVVVAGGTMQPLWEFQYQLFGAAGAPQERIVNFSCGHVIPPEYVLPIVLSRGPSNKELDFSWSQRGQLMDELSQLLVNMIQVVHGGLVCFLPSYEFEKQVFEHFKRCGSIQKIEKTKKVFREPKKANQVDQTLAEYAQCIRLASTNEPGAQTGALLFCVVGGKLSEGINFSDDLARCVVVVGLPYANSRSAELKEKMDFLNRTTGSLRPEGETRTPGQLHYESLCFKAVNQSIGRAIRHRNDYAALILADGRYARPASQAALPGWIASRLAVVDKFGPALVSVRKFLAERKKNHQC